MILRDEMYFEPRIINDSGKIRWFGEIYTAPEMLHHMLQTVYIRDSGSWLYVYELESDQFVDEEKIEAVFKLICKVEKHNKKYRYGRKIT